MLQLHQLHLHPGQQDGGRGGRTKALCLTTIPISYINHLPPLSELRHMITHLTALQSEEMVFITKGHGLKLLVPYNHRRRVQTWSCASSCAITSTWVLQKHFSSILINFPICSSVPGAPLLLGPSLIQAREQGCTLGLTLPFQPLTREIL